MFDSIIEHEKYGDYYIIDTKITHVFICIQSKYQWMNPKKTWDSKTKFYSI